MGGSEVTLNIRDRPNSVSPSATITRIYAGKLFDPETLEMLKNRVLTVSEETGLVHDVKTFGEGEYEIDDAEQGRVRKVDLRKCTVLPGFVDAHVHCESAFLDLMLLQYIKHKFYWILIYEGECIGFIVFLHDSGETSWEDQVNKESLVERTVRATVHAKRTLMAGFTSVRSVAHARYLSFHISCYEPLTNTLIYISPPHRHSRIPQRPRNRRRWRRRHRPPKMSFGP